jgi:DNA-binding transcriptional LysR family regulator
VRRGDLRRVLPGWCLPPHTVWALFPGRRLLPAKVRAFVDMLAGALPALAGTGTDARPATS